MSPELSIIIVSFNTSQITKDCLDSIYSFEKQMSSFEVIVIDNDSKDGSVKMLQDYQTKHDTLRLFQNDSNEGFGKANNKAVKLAKGTFVLLLNSDTVVLKNAVQNLLEYYKRNESTYQFVGGKLLNKDSSPQASAGPFYTPPVVFGALFLKGDYWGLTRSSPTISKQVDWLSGACIMTTKKIYEEVGGMDEGIFMYMEEVDLLYRARKMKYLTAFCAEAVFIHLGSASSGGKTYPILQVYKGFLYFYRKHYGLTYVFLLKCMLQLKAVVSLIIGYITNNSYLKNTYGKALKMAIMD